MIISILQLVLLSGCDKDVNKPIVTGMEVNQQNWTKHPLILEIDKIKDEIDKEISAKKYQQKEKSIEFSEPWVPTSKVVYLKEDNNTIKYTQEAGSDDSALRYQYYYDDLGKLRFVMISGGAVNGSELEHKIYFSSDGKRIWETHRYLKGPGYSFPEIWPEEEIVFNPKDEFEK